MFHMSTARSRLFQSIVVILYRSAEELEPSACIRMAHGEEALLGLSKRDSVRTTVGPAQLGEANTD